MTDPKRHLLRPHPETKDCQKLLQVVQLLLRVVLPEPWQSQPWHSRPKPPIRCPHCGAVIAIIAVWVREINPAPA